MITDEQTKWTDTSKFNIISLSHSQYYEENIRCMSHLQANVDGGQCISRLSDFCRGSSFRVCCTPLDQILTTSEQLCKVP